MRSLNNTPQPGKQTNIQSRPVHENAPSSGLGCYRESGNPFGNECSGPGHESAHASSRGDVEHLMNASAVVVFLQFVVSFRGSSAGMSPQLRLDLRVNIGPQFFSHQQEQGPGATFRYRND